ncbi:hypothetical protein [Streptomyces phage phiScoe3]|nr:hypothetical protein [Streptomyces phage phiScoe3]
MAIEFWRLRWIDPEGTPRASAVSYDRTVRDQRIAELMLDGAYDIEFFLYDPFTDKELSK